MMELTLTISIILLGLVFGSRIERRHFRSLQEREKKSLRLPAVTFANTLPLEQINHSHAKLVSANVVISIDAFKKLVSWVVSVLGGNMISYETLVDRARREAILRLKEANSNATIICNTRIETTSITKNAKQSVGAIEVLVYGTALYPDNT